MFLKYKQTQPMRKISMRCIVVFRTLQVNQGYQTGFCITSIWHSHDYDNRKWGTNIQYGCHRFRPIFLSPYLPHATFIYVIAFR